MISELSESDNRKERIVLLVDDNPKNLDVLSDLLIQNEYKVRTARSGKVALSYLENQEPGIILLDIKMPEMDGFEVCRKIKSDPKLQQIPIIFISALNELEDKTKAFSVGGVDYITKPFQVEEVLARVNTHISNRETQSRLSEEINTRLKAEEKLREAYTEVELKVEERTAEIKAVNQELMREIKEREKTEHELQKTLTRLEVALSELEIFKNRLETENLYLQEEIKTDHNFSEIIGNSKRLKKSLKMIEQVASSDTTVLILGETGTGKELVVRAIHNLSRLKKRPLVKVNCAALPSNLIESELFGHEKGAFTGADTKKIGRFELADQGTIFLDEIGDLPLELQAKLLRVLQENEFERLGSTKTQKVNVRVLAATNRNLEKLRSEGKFRDDLFFRLNVFPVESPPLRDREGDISMLVNHFVEKFNKKTGKAIDTVPQKVMDSLLAYDWPGNVRELENVIERAVILSQNNQLQLADWLTKDLQTMKSTPIKSLDQIQKDHIAYVLKLTNGRVKGDSGAASILGIKPTTLQSRMKKLGVEVIKKAEISFEAEKSS